ncbi:hypothetical protein MPOCJGCO_3144 [Methylobacterium trifolii]|uniref:Uncharacterized protein n=2 Tax=Methylobacterium trifolii TaxID=1003092 RepID=A0ABQ4U225_9HYPH|nr:hypothetical protein MPOCJGCO_3144 [Methylobacterium trifolii]
MFPDDALLLAAWAVLFVVLIAAAPRFLPPGRRRPAEPALQREDAFYETGGPVIEMEAA